MSIEATEATWQRRMRYLPLVLLVVATGVAMLTGPYTGATNSTGRLVAQLAVLAVTAALMCWHTFRQPTASARQSDPDAQSEAVAGPDADDSTRSRPWLSGAAYYVVRSALALILTLLNPLFCLFAWIGFLDADDHLRDHLGGRSTWAAYAATAVTMALGQSGGVPSGWTQLALFGGLLVVNFGLAFTMSRYAAHIEQTSRERAAAITDLERALADNAVLHEQVVAQARAAGIEEERRRLAGEIHDTIAQSLAGIVAQLQAAQDDPDGGRERIARATELSRAALAEARRSVQALAPVELNDTALVEAVSGLVTGWGRTEEVKADVVVTGSPRPLHPEVEATVLRITQEALSNVAKHAAAARVGVTLSYDEEEIILDVRDDGVGFDSNVEPSAGSFGLRGMRQRAERLAGALTVESETGHGTALSLRLPALPRGAA